GLAVDGIWGAKTYNAVVNVNPGARGNLTKVLQAALYLNGYTVVGKPDGIYGKNTKKALKQFQKAKGLTVDAIAGKSTFKALINCSDIIPCFFFMFKIKYICTFLCIFH